MEYEERKEKIIQVSKNLFLTKGYSKTTVNDIIKEINIAKGTFYYYFKSKEEVLSSVVDMQVNQMISKTDSIREQENLSLQERIINIFMAQSKTSNVEEQMLRDMHKQENLLMLQKYSEKMIHALTPVLSDIIEEGNRRGIFHADYPHEYMEMLLVSASVLTDDSWSGNEQLKRMNIIAALFKVLELMLGLEHGGLQKEQEYAMKGWR